MTPHQQTYRLYPGANQVATVTLRTDEPLYRIVERLVKEHGLPVVDQHGQPITYALYAGQIRRLSNEMTLKQAGYDQGGDLYLANIYAPWWEGIPAVTRRFGNDPPAPNARRIPYALIGIGAAVALMMIIGTVLLFTIFPGTRRDSCATSRHDAATGARRHTTSQSHINAGAGADAPEYAPVSASDSNAGVDATTDDGIADCDASVDTATDDGIAHGNTGIARKRGNRPASGWRRRSQRCRCQTRVPQPRQPALLPGTHQLRRIPLE
jgi:hypothetical protein